jgi:hypothetical protein
MTDPVDPARPEAPNAVPGRAEPEGPEPVQSPPASPCPASPAPGDQARAELHRLAAELASGRHSARAMIEYLRLRRASRG